MLKCITVSGRISRRGAIMAIAGCAMSALTVPAAAQDDARATEAQAATEGTDGWGDIVVTARRREESLQRTPVSMDAISGPGIERRGVANLMDLGTFIPNLSVGGGGTGPSIAAFAIRGIGSVRSGIEDEPPVAVYVDGVFLGTSDGALIEMIEPKRVEVLRGPQGTLYGKNALAGAIQYITQEPTDTLSGQISGTYGRFNRTDLRGWVNVPLGDKLSTRFTAASVKRNGTVRSLQTGIKSNDLNTRFVRGDMLWKPLETLSFRIYGDYSTVNTNGDGNLLDSVTFTDSRVVAYRNSGRDLSRDLTSDSFANNAQSRTYRNQKVWGGGLDINWTISDELSARAIVAHRETDLSFYSDRDGTRYTFLEQSDDRTHQQTSQELQLLGKHIDGRLNWIVGLYHFTEKASNISGRYEQLELNTAPIDQLFLEDNSSKAAFGEASFALTDIFTFTFGARYTSETKRSDATYRTRGSSAAPQVGSGSATFTNFSPRVVLQAQWTPDVMTYASYSRGFRSGGFNNRYNTALPNNGFIPYEDETLSNYELGLRSDWFDRRLRFNLTYFHSKYNGMQLATFFGTSATTFTQNAGAAKLDGVELDGALVVAPFFRLYFGGAYLDARYSDLGRVQDITLATPLPRSPKWSYNLGGQFDFELPGDFSLMLRSDYGYKGRQGLSTSDSSMVYQEGYGLLNARAELGLPGDRVTFAVFGRNLTDKRYLTSGLLNRGLKLVTRGEPVEWGFSAKVTF